MSKLIAMGEALIDFMPDAVGRLADIENFRRCPGGGPANAASAAAMLGVKSVLVSKVGQDAFGDFLEKAAKDAGIDTSGMCRTSEAKTALAFVSHTEDGERDFMFYRSPSADMLLAPEDIDPNMFKQGDILHFCSLDLIAGPCRLAHDRAIALARENGCLISFDVNLRFPLWNSKEELKETVLAYIPKSDIVKVSDDELEFLGEFSSPYRITTMGKAGARYQAEGIDVTVKGFNTPAIDTTGAGDSFMGTFLANIIKNGTVMPENAATVEKLFRFSHAAASILVGRVGALGMMPSAEEIEAFIAKNS